MKIFSENTRKNRTLRTRGFGSVELTLLVLAGAACFTWGMGNADFGTDEATTRAKAREVAAEIVKVTEAAKVAGVDLVQKGSVMGTVNRVEMGKTASFGYFAGEHYGIGKIESEVKSILDDFLYLDRGKLRLIH